MIDRKRRGKTTISPLLTFNLKVGFTFSVLSPSACFQCTDTLPIALKYTTKNIEEELLKPLETAHCG
mgnify:CR=1 FL=1